MKFGVVEGLYVLAPASAFWLFLASACYEFQDMGKKGAFQVIWANPLTFVAASTMGLGVNFLSYFVIQATSSLTMKVGGWVDGWRVVSSAADDDEMMLSMLLLMMR